MARPTTWTIEIENAAWDYINGGWEEEEHAFPSVVGLCAVLGRGKSTIYDWASHNDKGFSDILDKINECQEMVAWNKGLKGEYNANLVKLLLGKHGYSDRVDSSHNVTALDHEDWLDSLDE